jgi:tetratricopeptide (TPR) repeat protein
VIETGRPRDTETGRAVVFLGTCQAEALCRVYNSLICEDGEQPAHYVSSNVPFGDKERALLSAATAIVNQVFSFEQAATLPQSGLSAKIVDFPYMAGLFLWPYATEDHAKRQYFPEAKAHPYDAEIGDAFLNRLIRQGMNTEDAVEKYTSMDILKIASVERRADIIFHQQKAREAETEVKVYGFMQENLSRPDLFLTRGHPGLPLLLHLARQVFELLDIPGHSIGRLNYTLIRVPDHINQAAIHPAIAKFFGLEDEGCDQLYDQYYGRYNFAECARRYMNYEWNRPIVEGIYFGDHGHNDRAVQCLTEGLLAEPNSAPARQMLGRVLERMGRLEEAVRAMRIACELEPSNPYFAIHCSYALLASGDIDSAEATLRNALTFNPNFPDLNITLSHLLTKRRQIPAAIETAERAVKYSAKVRTMLPHLGRLLMSNQEFDRAVEICSRAVRTDPQDAALHFALADAYWRAGQAAAALNACDQAITLAPSEVRYRIHSADWLLKSERLEEAASAYLQVLQIDPLDRLAREVLANLFPRLGKIEGAVAHAMAALDQRPEDPSLLLDLGNQLENVGRLTEAASCFLEALIVDPTSARIHLLLSGVLAKQNKLDEAICAAMNASNLEPGNQASSQHLNDLIAARKMQRSGGKSSHPDTPTKLP